MGGAQRRILGVDFSGARDAGRKIWVAEGRRRSTGAMALVDVRPACDLAGGGLSPESAIAALARHILKLPDTVAGCDFPFSIPRALIEESSWEDFVAKFPDRFADADAFRNWAFRKAGMREIRRAADRAAATPFNSYNLRIHRQTWWGISALLNPLIRSRTAVIRPYQKMPREPRPIIIEACPACSLKSIGFYPPYKGRADAQRTARKAVLRRLIADGYLESPSRQTARLLIDNVGGDALDAVVAAIATAQADLVRDADANEMFEGRIYGALRAQGTRSPIVTKR